MCGLAGAFSWKDSATSPREADVVALRDHMWKRGQDGTGLWTSPDGRALLGHRRLAIIDLDPRSRQPLERGPLQIVFNGEIYNYRALRQRLEKEGEQFRTEGDSEVILALYSRLGPAALDELRGMFALAIYDSDRRSLFLARDPYGIKPLYYADVGGTVYFASQVKALTGIAAIPRESDPAGIVGFHLMGSVPEPFTTHRSISALPAGHHLTIGENRRGEVIRYAHIAAVLAAAQRDEQSQIGNVIRDAMLDSVRAHLVADVEVGLFLSAGIDSGALLGLMRDCGQRRIRAFSLGFEGLVGSDRDEVPMATKVAQRYGAEHHVDIVTADDFTQSAEQIIQDMDQPTVDGVNSWFVSRAAARGGLKVVLSGLGGDELLAGYGTFRDVPRTHGIAATTAKTPVLGAFARWVFRRFGPVLFKRNPKAGGVLEYGRDLAGAYLLRRAVLLPFELDRVLDRDTIRDGMARLNPIASIGESIRPDPGSDPARVMALESANYMRNQLLRDSDWASMAHTLELRVPLVDWPTLQRIAPIAHRLVGRLGKESLAAAPSVPLPTESVSRPRSGFSVPVGSFIGASSPFDRLGSRHWARRVAQSFAA